MSMEAKPYLRSIKLKRDDIADFGRFPYTVPVIRQPRITLNLLNAKIKLVVFDVKFD